MGINRVEVSGRIEAIEAARVSPAGVPSIRFSVMHESTQMEAGHPRKVECTLRVVLVGPEVQSARALAAGTEVTIIGFLARASVRNDWPVLHATELKVI